MSTRDRKVRVNLSADVHQRLKDEAERRGLTVTDLASRLVTETLLRFPSVLERQP